MSHQAEPRDNVHPSPGRGAWWVGGLLFVVGIAVGGWGAFHFFVKEPPREPTFAATSTGKANASANAAANASAAADKTLLQVGSTPRTPTLAANQVDNEPKRALRYEGPIQLTDAVLLNGGGSAQSNYFSHHLHIRMLLELLKKRGLSQKRIAVFSSDGEDRSPDQLVLSSMPMSWLFSGLREDQLVNATSLVDTTLRGHRMFPAKRRSLGRYFRNLAKKVKRRKKPSTVLLFVTDHGTPGRGPLGNKIELWEEQLTVRQLQRMVDPIGPKNRVISVMSQCYSGGFANLLYTRRWSVQGNRCGFFSTLSNREAYGCFPETAKEDRVGHAYRMIRALRSASTYGAAHRQILLRDRTPDVPIATSDVYLEDLLRKQAKRRRVKPHAEIDRWLRRVWKKPPSWLRSELQLLGKLERSFHLKPYRYVSDVWGEIDKNRNDLKSLQSLETVWKQVWNEVQRGVLMSFYQHNRSVATAVDNEMNRPDVDDQTRRVGQTLYRAYAKHVKQSKPIKRRMTRLYERFHLVQKQSHIYHTYEAALMRVAMRLTRIAGLYMLRQRGANRAQVRGLKRLLACEETPIRGRPFRTELRAEGPNTGSRKPKMALQKRIPLKKLLPSRLGIGFQPAPADWHPSFARTAPGAVLVNNVTPGSPAANAGLQKGDVIASVGGQMLQLDSEIRDLVMLAPPRKKIFFMVHRGQRFVTLPVQLAAMNGPGEQPPQGDPQDGFPPQGMGDSIDPNQGGTAPDWQGQGDPIPHGFQPDPNTRVYGMRGRQLRIPSRRGGPPAKGKLVTIDGKPIAFPAKRGATLLFFWATWCEGCKAMVPMLRRLHRRYRAKGLTLLAVTTDGPRLLRPFQRQWGARFPFQIAIDKGGILTRRYRVTAIPQLLLFSKDGQLISQNSHLSPGQRRQLIRDIRKHSRAK